MSQPLMSIIIPCYGQAQLLDRAIRSCFDSNDIPIEVIVVDDGSPDDVEGAVARFGERVRTIRKRNGGLSSARNTGLRHATGRFIKFLDADDWLMPGALTRQTDILQQIPTAILITGYRLTYPDVNRPVEDYYPNFSSWQSALAHGNVAPIHAFTVPSEVISAVGDFDETLANHEDYDFWLRTALLDVEVILHHKVECVYFRQPESMSSVLNHVVSGAFTVWKKHAASIRGSSLPLMTIAQYLKQCVSFMNQYPDDPAIEEFSRWLLQMVETQASTANLPDTLEASEAVAQALLPRSSKELRTLGSRALRLLLERINWPMSDYDKHLVQRTLFAVGQTLLRAGNRRLALLCFDKTQGLGPTYGLDYRFLSRWLSALGTVMPGPVAVAVYKATETLMQSYWKHLNNLFYQILCPERVERQEESRRPLR
jgi:GT2 family glycosyltransferase